MKRTTDLQECLSCSCFAVRRAARAITQHYDRRLRPSGLRATQFTLLVVLALEGRKPLGRIADRLGTERTTLTRNLRPLVARGLVVVGSHPDRRIQLLEASPRGIAVARKALPLWREAQRSIAGLFTPEALRSLEVATQAASRARSPGSTRSTDSKKEG
jgi:DNA-binding MarR family transcriptional regulator